MCMIANMFGDDKTHTVDEFLPKFDTYPLEEPSVDDKARAIFGAMAEAK